MQLEIGQIVEGEVNGITKFGAFVKLPNGQIGLVHISEISTSFVRNVSDFLKDKQKVKVKVLNIMDNGKLSLSIKQAQESQEPKKFNNRGRKLERVSGQGVTGGTANNANFENLLSQFKKSSDERVMDSIYYRVSDGRNRRDNRR